MSEFICISCGKCCGPVPISNTDWDNIVTAVENMSFSDIEHLINQEREDMTCIFRDNDFNKCAIYEHRPLICRLQGTREGLPCPNMPRYAKGDSGRFSVNSEFGENREYLKGILSVDIGYLEVLEIIRKKEDTNAKTEASQTT